MAWQNALTFRKNIEFCASAAVAKNWCHSITILNVILAKQPARSNSRLWSLPLNFLSHVLFAHLISIWGSLNTSDKRNYFHDGKHQASVYLWLSDCGKFPIVAYITQAYENILKVKKNSNARKQFDRTVRIGNCKSLLETLRQHVSRPWKLTYKRRFSGQWSCDVSYVSAC